MTRTPARRPRPRCPPGRASRSRSRWRTGCRSCRRTRSRNSSRWRSTQNESDRLKATLPPVRAASVHALDQGGLGRRQVPQVALAEHHLGLGHEVLVHVVGPDQAGRAQAGAHRALGVAGHEDQAAGRGRAVGGRRRRRSARRPSARRGRTPRRAGRRAPCPRTPPVSRTRPGRPRCWPPSRPTPRCRGPCRRRCARPSRSSISCIEPLTMPWLSRKASSARASTSTMALPMATTSRVLSVMERSVIVGRSPVGTHIGAPVRARRRPLATGPGQIRPDRPPRPVPGVGTLGPSHLRTRSSPCPKPSLRPPPSTSPIPTACRPPRCRRATTSSSSRTWPPSPSAAPAPPRSTVPAATDVLVCNAIELEIRSAWVELADGEPGLETDRASSSTRRPNGSRSASWPPVDAGDVRAAHRVHRPAQRQAPRLLPQHLHRRPG